MHTHTLKPTHTHNNKPTNKKQTCKHYTQQINSSNSRTCFAARLLGRGAGAAREDAACPRAGAANCREVRPDPRALARRLAGQRSSHHLPGCPRRVHRRLAGAAAGKDRRGQVSGLSRTVILRKRVCCSKNKCQSKGSEFFFLVSRFWFKKGVM